MGINSANFGNLANSQDIKKKKLTPEELKELQQKQQVGTTLSERVSDKGSIFGDAKTGSAKAQGNDFNPFVNNGTSFINSTRDAQEAKKAEMKEKSDKYLGEDGLDNLYDEGFNVNFTNTKTGSAAKTGASAGDTTKKQDSDTKKKQDSANKEIILKEIKSNPKKLNEGLAKLQKLGLSDEEINTLLKENGIKLPTGTAGMSASLNGFDKQIAASEGWTKPSTASSNGTSASGSSDSSEGGFLNNITQKIGDAATAKLVEKTVSEPIEKGFDKIFGNDKKSTATSSTKSSSAASSAKSSHGVDIPDEVKDDPAIKTAEADYAQSQSQLGTAQSQKDALQQQLAPKEQDLKTLQAEEQKIGSEGMDKDTKTNYEKAMNDANKLDKEASDLKAQSKEKRNLSTKKEETAKSEEAKATQEGKNAKTKEDAAKVNASNITKLEAEIAKLEAEDKDGTNSATITERKAALAKEKQEKAKNEREAAEHRALEKECKTNAEKLNKESMELAQEAVTLNDNATGKSKKAKNIRATAEEKFSEEKKQALQATRNKITAKQGEIDKIKADIAAQDAIIQSEEGKMEMAQKKILTAVNAAKKEMPKK